MWRKLKVAVSRGVVIGLLAWFVGSSPNLRSQSVSVFSQGMQWVSRQVSSVLAQEARQIDGQIQTVNERLAVTEELSGMARSPEERQAYAAERNDLEARRLAKTVDLGRVAEQADAITQAGQEMAADWNRSRGYHRPAPESLVRQLHQQRVELSETQRDRDRHVERRLDVESNNEHLRQQLGATATLLDELKSQMEIQRERIESLAKPATSASPPTTTTGSADEGRAAANFGGRVRLYRLRSAPAEL